MPDFILYASLALSTFSAWLVLRHCLHMFQLNSYKPGVQLRWMRLNRNKLAPALIPIFGGLFFWPTKKKKALVKKPLVYTARVKRLLVTACLPYLLGLALPPLAEWLNIRLYGYPIGTPWLLPLFCQFIYIIIAGWLAPWFLLIANWVNKPIEQAIRNQFTKEAKQKLANAPDLTVIGITGSYGKTSVKHFLNTLLRAKYNVLMTPGGANVPMSVVRTIREELTAAHEIFICEMGAKNIGDIKELCDIVHPKHGILTAIGPQHLESFKTQENVIKTKFELGDSLPSDGILFACGEDENIATKLGDYPNVITYASYHNGSNYFAEDIQVDERGTSFTLAAPDGTRERMSTRLIGRHNVVNLVGAAAAAHTLGVPLRALKGQMRKIEPVRHRLELIDRGGGTLIIDDAYNSNPTGAKAALDTLALFAGTKILVTPGMVELGSEQESLNRVFGGQAAQVCDYIALVGVAQTKPIYEGILAAGFPAQKLIVEDTLKAALEKVYAIASDTRKIILLENDLPDNF